MNETVTEGNCPWWLMESGSLEASKWVKADNGMGVARVVDGAELEVPELTAAPEVLVVEEPGALVVPEPDRVVLDAAVLLLEELPVELLADRIALLVPAVAFDAESAALALAAEVPGVVSV